MSGDIGAYAVNRIRGIVEGMEESPRFAIVTIVRYISRDKFSFLARYDI